MILDQDNPNYHINKDIHKATSEARKERDYYKGLAGMYMLTYDEQVTVSKAIMVIQGILVSMNSDLLEHLTNSGKKGEKFIKAQSRLILLDEQISVISKVQTDNHSLKQSLKKAEEKLHLQFCEINDLKRQLQLHTDAL